MITDLKFYLKLLMRRSPVMIVLFLVAAIAGVVISQRMPAMYRTTAKLLVESSQISDDLVRSTVQVNTSEQLAVFQQRLLTRANLIDIANEIQVFPDARLMTPDDIVKEMRRRTSIRREGGRDRATIMSISFLDPSPRKAFEVVNRYVSRVQEENADLRKDRSEGTLKFFEDEVRKLSEDLDLQGARILAFKAENKDALPDNLNFRLNRQALLQERIAGAERELRALELRYENAQQTFEATGAAPIREVLTPTQVQLRNLENQLQASLGIYSETNPRIRSLRTQIEVLRAQVTNTAQSASSQVDGEPVSPLDLALADLNAGIETQRQEIERTTLELDELQKTIELTPANQSQLRSMERDMSNTQAQFNAAVARLNEARQSERVEISGVGEKISVLEAASVPSAPSSPNRPKIMVMGVGLGLALAAGFFFLLELINQSIRRPADIVKTLDVTPLATIPRIETLGHKRRRRVMQISSLVLVLIGVPVLLWLVDTYYIPLDQLFEKLTSALI